MVDNFHVRAYKEEGITITPFDIVVRDDLGRFDPVLDVIDRLPLLCTQAGYAKQAMRDRLIEHRIHIREHGGDLPVLMDWRRPSGDRQSCPAC
jgi:xylulose-5-phosphate/fructose-6-phosphate phosphoketolase